MHIEIRDVKGTIHYYLAHSYRKLDKIRKVRVYLGHDLSKSELKEKSNAAKARINEKLSVLEGIPDPYATVLSAQEIDELKQLGSAGKIKLSHLSEDDWLKFTENFVYDTNAIEGSSIDQKEAKDIIEKNEWPDKPKQEISETQGVAEAVRYIRATREHLSIQLMLDLHRIVFKNSKGFAGHLRKAGEEVAVISSSREIIHRGAPSHSITLLLKNLVKWYGEYKDEYPPLVLAAVVHNQFENIHPFRDGNGRVGRLLLVNILLKHKLPPVNIELKNRTQYYNALQEYELHGNIRPTIQLILKEYRRFKKSLSM
jgi:Fic family protein